MEKRYRRQAPENKDLEREWSEIQAGSGLAAVNNKMLH
jgi:hypothetical protein